MQGWREHCPICNSTCSWNVYLFLSQKARPLSVCLHFLRTQVFVRWSTPSSKVICLSVNTIILNNIIGLKRRLLYVYILFPPEFVRPISTSSFTGKGLFVRSHHLPSQPKTRLSEQWSFFTAKGLSVRSTIFIHTQRPVCQTKDLTSPPKACLSDQWSS